ncbi:MAG TPA: S-layer homology domain-containing protein [Firmicutes bacterium]|nr:S-layer homology domain-containing protein [Bacillota bacterium]
MDVLAGGQNVSFDIIKNDIYYLLDAGSYVVDEIGNDTYNGANYDFDFVNDAASLILTVGGNQYTATAVTDGLEEGETARYSFTYDGVNATNGAAAPFVLRYFQDGTIYDGSEYDECFVWEINVPVSNFAPVQLTYTVKLTDPQTASGTYGQYDEDGEETTSTGLYTNNSATLYPVDSNGYKHVPEAFAKPTVSYTVGGSSSGGGGGNPSEPSIRPDEPDDLNTEDHYAYIIGYPIDYRTGEPTDDKSVWPVQPQGNITRAELTKVAVGFFDVTGDYEDGTFSDVDADSWYADFIDAAFDLGLVEGYPDGTIRPQAYITRAEAATMVNRTLGRVPDTDHLLPEDEMRVWPDNSDADAWYYAQIQEATNSHDYEWITSGGEEIENWTHKLNDRIWEQLEREWSDAYSAPGGEVVD